jgi:serine/threonine-protein phosphatase 2A regulatory subunit B'
MSTVIIPHLDLVINMIEKNIFRPLPILKKAGLPGEGVGMEEVFYYIKIRNNYL